MADLLDRSRLVTLTGVGGTGKTRLSLEVAAAWARSSEVPAAFVDLSPVSDPELVVHSVASALGVRQGRNRSLLNVLVNRLRHDPSLLVLDNCEHLIDACAELAEHLLRSCAPLRMLATSRERLNITGEIAWTVPPLSLPGPADDEPGALAGSEAVQLFCDRAAGVNFGFVLTTDNAPAVAEICRRLDGNALAIELAGARADVLTPAEITARLEDRFDLLVSGSRNAPLRQKTLKAALDWSYDLLSEPERALLCRLSVFAGGFTLGAVRDVCSAAHGPISSDDVLALITRLVSQSLVVTDTAGPATRYRLLDSIREYTRDKLREGGEAADLQALHAAWCVVMLEESVRHGPHSGQRGEWADALEAEQDNVRVALEWALSNRRPKLSLRLTRAQLAFWELRGRYGEARQWLDRALPLSQRAPPGLRAAVLHDAGLVAVMLGDLEGARKHLEKSMAICARIGDARGSARARNLLGFVSTFTGAGESVEELEQALDEMRESGDDTALAESLAACGRARMFKGEAAVAATHFEESVEAAQRIENDSLLASGLVGLGWSAMARGEYRGADLHLREALELAEDLGDAHIKAVALCWLAELSRLQGDPGAATEAFEDALVLARRMAAPHPVARCLIGLGRTALLEGELPRARALFEEAASLARGAGMGQAESAALAGLGEASMIDGDLASARTFFDDALATARESGDKRGTAHAFYRLGMVARSASDNDGAAALHHDAMELQREIDDRAGIVATLEGLAGVAVDQGQDEDAGRLFGAADALRQKGGYARGRPESDRHAADVKLLHKRMTKRGLDLAWKQGSAISLDEALAYAAKRRRGKKRPAGGWAGLTATERDVVDLVEKGFTNAEIATRLLISRETVKTHMSRVLAKVGVTSRQALRDAARQRMGA